MACKRGYTSETDNLHRADIQEQSKPEITRRFEKFSRNIGYRRAEEARVHANLL